MLLTLLCPKHKKIKILFFMDILGKDLKQDPDLDPNFLILIEESGSGSGFIIFNFGS